MACLYRSAVTLRIIGDDLLPVEITDCLGGAPTQAQTKGEKIVGKKTGHVRTARLGMWRLQATNREPADISGQIFEILDQLTADISVWQSITSRYKADLFCGLFMDCSTEGLELSPKSLSALGSRGVKMGLDIYGPDGDEEKTKSEVEDAK